MPKLALQKRNATLGLRLGHKVQVEVDGLRVFGSKDVDLVEDLRLDHLLLPRYRDGARAELLIERVVLRVKAYTFDRRKL